MKSHPFSSFTMRAAGMAVAGVVVWLSGCEEKDPGIQAELIQLKAERSQLTNRVQELENSIQSKNEEINKLKSSVSENADVDSFDKQASMTSFITKVAELKGEIQQKFPDAQLSDSVQMPSFDAPLQSEIRIDVRKPGQAVISYRWTGRGKLTGEWEFAKSEETAVAAVDPSPPSPAPAPPSPPPGPPPTPPAPSPTPSPPPTDGVVTKPQPPPPATNPASDIPAGSRLVREDANGKVWLTPDGRYIIKLNQ
jgi:hypothetical protein